MRHVVNMTSASSVGLMALFVVDLVDMYFLSLLGEVELAAAVGYAGTVLFFTTSICIGIAIATGALVSRSLGANKNVQARNYVANTFIYALVLGALVSAVLWPFIDNVLMLLGSTGKALELAGNYLRIVVPSMALLALGMASSGVLRATGDAKRSMYITLAGGGVNAVLDPILIFGLSMGIEGAAWASFAARVTIFVVGLHGVVNIHKLVGELRFKRFLADFLPISKIAVPAIMTNLATPIGNAYVVLSMAKFGDSAVAGMSVIGRVTPVAFGVIFALSGAVGPIVGQNFGAKRFDRVNQTVIDAVIFTVVFVVAVAVVLFFSQAFIIAVFDASADAASLISLFCTFIAITFIFNGLQFVAHAAFNNLGFPHYSTISNFGKATIGTMPFVFAGAHFYGASGVLIGQALGAVLFGVLAIWYCFTKMKRIALIDNPEFVAKPVFQWRTPAWPFTSNRG